MEGILLLSLIIGTFFLFNYLIALRTSKFMKKLSEKLSIYSTKINDSSIIGSYKNIPINIFYDKKSEYQDATLSIQIKNNNTFSFDIYKVSAGNDFQKSIGLNKDIKTDDEAFDSNFIVTSDDPSTTKLYLSNESRKEIIIDLLRDSDIIQFFEDTLSLRMKFSIHEESRIDEINSKIDKLILLGKFTNRIENKEDMNLSSEKLLEILKSNNFDLYMIARNTFLKQGIIAMKFLLNTYNNSKNTSYNESIIFIIKKILQTREVSNKKEKGICSDCYIKSSDFKIDDFKLYGCRNCARCSDFKSIKGKIINIIDNNIKEKVLYDGNDIKVNWFKHKQLFDFDEVMIVDAKDEDIEKFAVMVSNDVDEIRRKKYKDVTCKISKTCDVSDNTKRILENIFINTEYFIPESVNIDKKEILTSAITEKKKDKSIISIDNEERLKEKK